MSERVVHSSNITQQVKGITWALWGLGTVPPIISPTPRLSPPPQLLFSQLVWTREVPPIWATEGLGQCHSGSASPGAPLRSGRCLRGDQLWGGGAQGNVRAHVRAASADSPVSRAEREFGNELGRMKSDGLAGGAGLRVAAPGWRSAQGGGSVDRIRAHDRAVTGS